MAPITSVRVTPSVLSDDPQSRPVTADLTESGDSEHHQFNHTLGRSSVKFTLTGRQEVKTPITISSVTPFVLSDEPQ